MNESILDGDEKSYYDPNLKEPNNNLMSKVSMEKENQKQETFSKDSEDCIPSTSNQNEMDIETLQDIFHQAHNFLRKHNGTKGAFKWAAAPPTMRTRKRQISRPDILICAGSQRKSDLIMPYSLFCVSGERVIH
ncbi:hypothetical protein NQ318_022806 [Aromia moschata]|uniref:Uncharacterized protein n=1 Tax=Aromia moschata TaxID=1265417 RepID=A0AAV8XPV5_9CUCU|nr:hypothetical protein NQ318_022806 [Aromia moschata]